MQTREKENLTIPIIPIIIPTISSKKGKGCTYLLNHSRLRSNHLCRNIAVDQSLSSWHRTVHCCCRDTWHRPPALMMTCLQGHDSIPLHTPHNWDLGILEAPVYISHFTFPVQEIFMIFVIEMIISSLKLNLIEFSKFTIMNDFPTLLISMSNLG